MNIFTPADLYSVMDKALQNDKVDFVKLLLNQGVSMREYLTVTKLETLFNSVSYLFLKLNTMIQKLSFYFQHYVYDNVYVHRIIKQ